MCNIMHDDWQTYYRTPTRTHTIEAKPAKGGEEVGDDIRKKIAQKSEWICRNPINGYTWSMKEHDFYEFYMPFDKKYLPEEEAKPQKSKDRTSASNESQKNLESGPLFD
jgi:hypothetical protein